MKILCFGEILWDIYGDKKVIGGAPFNFAAHAVKSGAETYLVSAVGKDSFGEEAIVELEKKGVNSKFVKIKAGVETGKCLVELEDGGIPRYTLKTSVAYDEIEFDEDLDADALYFGTLALRSEKSRKTLLSILAKKRDLTVFCDLNLRKPFYDEEVVKLCLEKSTVIKLSDGEAEFVTTMLGKKANSVSQAIEIIFNEYQNLKTVVITCGADGAYAANRNGVYYCPALATKVVSTVGAGDSFGAVFLVETLKKTDIESALKLASERSAYVVSHLEAIPD
jgi:fructokinase